jgi:hypothetical protein
MIQSAEEFVRLRKSDKEYEYRRAGREEASVEVWVDIISKYPEMRRWVAQNKTVPIEVLSLLANDPDERVRLMVAMKRKLSPEILELLAADDDDSVRLSVARHRRVPRAVLERFIDDPWDRIREVAEHRLEEFDNLMDIQNSSYEVKPG